MNKKMVSVVLLFLSSAALAACQQHTADDPRRKYIEEVKLTNSEWESYALFAKPSDTCGEVQATFKTYSANGEVCCDEVTRKCRLAWKNISQGLLNYRLDR